MEPLEEKIHKIDKEVSQLLVTVEATHKNISENISRMDKNLSKITYSVDGNGKLGLSGKVAVMWRSGIFVVTALGLETFIIIREIFLK